MGRGEINLKLKFLEDAGNLKVDTYGKGQNKKKGKWYTSRRLTLYETQEEI